MKKLIVLVAIGLLAFTAAYAIATNGPNEITMSTKMGNVTFPHASHQGKISDCSECHHKGTETPKCTNCHGRKDGLPDAKKVFHAQCKGCHKKSGGPTNCKECHIK